MKQNSPLKGFVERFYGILNAFDELGANEEQEELNAEFEDAIFLLESIDSSSEDATEEIEDALDEIDALCKDFRESSENDSERLEIVLQMEMAARMARQNLL